MPPLSLSLFRSLAVAMLVGGLSFGSGWQPVGAAGLGLQLGGDPDIATLLSAEQALLDLTNADRVAQGLEPLELDYETLAIARRRAASQLTAAGLTHYDGNGELAFVHMLADSQVPYQLAGENLARASTDDAALTDRIEQALMRSPTHRKNILEQKFKRVAIGAAIDNTRITFAEIFRS